MLILTIIAIVKEVEDNVTMLLIVHDNEELMVLIMDDDVTYIT